MSFWGKMQRENETNQLATRENETNQLATDRFERKEQQDFVGHFL